MKQFCRSLTICLALTGVILAQSNAPAGSVDVPIPHKACTGNLAEVLRFLAIHYHVPIIAELTYPVPDKITVEASSDTAIAFLGKVLPQASGYAYEFIDGRIVHFYGRDIVTAKGDFLNIRINNFTIPTNLSDFKLALPAAINSARMGLPGAGSVISGFPSKEMEEQKLQAKEITKMSGRELLIATAEETPSFYTIIVFANKDCDSEVCFSYANQHWFWGPLTGKPSAGPIFIQTPPR